MSSSAPDSGGRAGGLRTRALVAAAIAVLAGVVGAAEQASPYDLRVDADGEGPETIPPGSIAIVDETRPSVGDLAAYHSPTDDLAAALVESVHATDGDRIYTLVDDGPGGDRTVVGDTQVLGRLVADVPYVGTPWTLSMGTQVAINVSLVGTYMAIGAYRSGAVGLEGLIELLGGQLRR